jgi:outer membrane protein assembly factor BamD (BamD/ComL family)
MAFASLAQFRGIRFDATPVIDARQQLLDLARAYPKIAEEENIIAIVQRVDTALARKLYETADFFRRTDKPEAAAYYYDYLSRTYPGSDEAEKARKRLASASRPVPATQPAATGPAANAPKGNGK